MQTWKINYMLLVFKFSSQIPKSVIQYLNKIFQETDKHFELWYIQLPSTPSLRFCFHLLPVLPSLSMSLQTDDRTIERDKVKYISF